MSKTDGKDTRSDPQRSLKGESKEKGSKAGKRMQEKGNKQRRAGKDKNDAQTQ